MAGKRQTPPPTGESQTPRVADGWQISLEFKQWKMKDKRAFDNLLVRADTDENAYIDEAESYPHLMRLIEKWPYPLDPKDPASYDELTVEQFQECWTQIYAAFLELQQRTK